MIELINNFFTYLRDEKNIKSEKKLRHYYEYIYQFLMEFLPLEYPEITRHIANLDGPVIEEYMGYWLFETGLISSEADLKSSGLALRHFFKFLYKTDRISKAKLNYLSEVARYDNYSGIFDREEEYDEVESIFNEWLSDVNEDGFLETEETDFAANLFIEKISAAPEKPPFINLLKYFLESVAKGTFDQREFFQGDFYIEDNLTGLLKKSNFLPYHSAEEFFRSLIWLCEELGLIMFGKKHWLLLEDGRKIITLTDEEIWLKILLGLRELFYIIHSIGGHEDTDRKKAGDFYRFIRLLQQMPTNMWIEIRSGYSIYHRNPLTQVADGLARLIDYGKNRPLYYLCQAAYWTGVIDIKTKDKTITNIIKSSLGGSFFDSFSSLSDEGR